MSAADLSYVAAALLARSVLGYVGRTSMWRNGRMALVARVTAGRNKSCAR